MSRRGQSEGTIYRRSDGRWEGKVSVGQGRRDSYYGATRAEVGQAITKALRERDQGTYTKTSKQKVGPFLLGWLASIKLNVRPSTYTSYEMWTRRHLIPGLGHLQLTRLRPEQVQALLDGKLAGGLSPQSVTHMRGILRLALGRAVKFGAVSRNVAALTEPPRMHRKEIAPFDLDTARAFLAAIEGDPRRALYTLALMSGLRQGELLGLSWGDLDLNGGELRVGRALQKFGGRYQLVEPKTSRSRRRVPLPRLAVEALRELRAEQVAAGRVPLPSALIFTTEAGAPLASSNVTKTFWRLLVRSGLPRIRFHDLRHSFATLLLAQGEHPRVVMELLGHSTIALTMNTYTHVMPAFKQETAARLDVLMRGTAG